MNSDFKELLQLLFEEEVEYLVVMSGQHRPADNSSIVLRAS